MEMSAFIQSLQSHLGGSLPALLGAVVVFVLGYIAATLLQVFLGELFKKINLNNRLNTVKEQVGSAEASFDLESLLASIVFWFVMLLTLVGVLNILNVEQLSIPLSNVTSQILGYLPSLLSGVLLIILAYYVAKLSKISAAKVLNIAKISKKQAKSTSVSLLQKNMGNLVFWAVILLFLPVILGAFQISSLLEPVQNMLDKVFQFFPNLLAAGLTFLVGWTIASLIKNLVSGLLNNIGADDYNSKLDLKVSVSESVGNVIFLLIILPVFVASLDALQIQSVSAPASKMLEMVLLAIPNVISATLIVVITYLIARVISKLIAELVAASGLDAIIADIFSSAAFPNGFKLSVLAGKLTIVFAMLFAFSEAANRMGFITVQDMFSQLIHFGANVMLGMIILMIGIWLSGVVQRVILSSNSESSGFMGNLARVAVLTLISAMGLSAMGIADSVVNITLSMLIGAIAIAFALAFGLGGRDAAAKQLDQWFGKSRK